MFSIICASNNKDVLFKELRHSLSIQTYSNFELIIIDTIAKKYNGAADALNAGVKMANGDYLVFCHQDLILPESELYNISNQIKCLGKFGMLGVAGKTSSSIIGNITNGITKRKISKKQIENPTEVQTLDEAMFIIPKDIVTSHPFDESNHSWHLYAVEYALRMHQLKKRVCVIPSFLHHSSSGESMSNDYFKEIRRLTAKYRCSYDIIYTTMGNWHTNNLLLELDILSIHIQLILIFLKKRILIGVTRP